LKKEKEEREEEEERKRQRKKKKQESERGSGGRDYFIHRKVRTSIWLLRREKKIK
jgi:hypothetical protein